MESALNVISENMLYDARDTSVELINLNGLRCVRKNVKSFLGSSHLAEILCNHEVKVLERVRGVNGVQQLVEQDSRTSFISKYEPGVALRYSKNIPRDYFEKLSAILRNIHERGVADIDFAHSTDLLVSEEGNPIVIDLASALIYDKNKMSSFIKKPLFDYICKLNKKYIIRRKLRFLPELSSRKDEQESKLDLLSESWRNFRSYTHRK